MARDFGAAGTTYNITVPSNSRIGLDGASKATMCAWILPFSAGGSGQGRIMEKRAASGATSGWVFALNSEANRQVFFGINANGNFSLSNNNAITYGEWQHVMSTMDLDANNNLLYVNGVDVTNDSSIVQSSISGNTLDMHIGLRIDTARGFHGYLAELAIWKDVVLTESERMSLVNGQYADRVRPNFQVYYAPLFGDDSPEPDMSPYRQHGTVDRPTRVPHPSIMKPRSVEFPPYFSFEPGGAPATNPRTFATVIG